MPAAVGRAYVMSKKEAATSGMVVTGTLFLNSNPFCTLFDSSITHSFISTQSTLQLNLENKKAETNYRIKLPNNSIVECPISYKHIPITIGGIIFPRDMIQFDSVDVNIIFRMNSLHTYRVKIDCEGPKVILRDKKEK